jgi:hypothetical protein
MDNTVRQKLQQLIAADPGLCDNPTLCGNRLADAFPTSRLEVNLLRDALRERVVTDLRVPPAGQTRPVLFGRLAKRLQDNLGLAEDRARWAVETWAAALGVISSAEADRGIWGASAPPTAVAAAAVAGAPPKPPPAAAASVQSKCSPVAVAAAPNAAPAPPAVKLGRDLSSVLIYGFMWWFFGTPFLCVLAGNALSLFGYHMTEQVLFYALIANAVYTCWAGFRIYTRGYVVDPRLLRRLPPDGS